MKIGADIVHISRFQNIDDFSLKKIFHPSELENKDPLHLAGVFAAKECCRKIFPNSNWLDFEIKKQRNGKPAIHTKNDFKGDLSISHDNEYAIAVVIVE
ncbi:MAG: 4'-phosphopantetheinyl transferase superfamily protein [Nanoarchaeota archaeon]|nr:4'-phosphopantetheinyl transferase superfamily protein [Nanoarchaeota archaeon]